MLDDPSQALAYIVPQFPHLRNQEVGLGDLPSGSVRTSQVGTHGLDSRLPPLSVIRMAKRPSVVGVGWQGRVRWSLEELRPVG